jgi:hypothetical protein
MTWDVQLRDLGKLQDALERLVLPDALPIYREGLLGSARLVIEESRGAFLSGQVLGVITGELRDSLEADPAGIPRFVDVGSYLPQAGALHFGAKGKGLRPRPYLFPAAEIASARMPEVWEQAIDAALGASS